MEETYIHQNRIRQIIFIGAIVLLGYLLIRHLVSFLPALLGAITLYILMRRMMLYFVHVRKWNKSLAAWLLMLASFIIIMIPIGSLVSLLTGKVAYAIGHSNELVAALKTLINQFEDRYDIELMSNDMVNRLGNFIAQGLPKVLGATFSTLGTLFFMYFFLYFMLVNGRNMERDLYEYVPLHDANVDKIGKEINNMVFSNAIGIPVIGILQGVVAVIGYLIIGVQEPWFWFVITCMTAMLPVVGAALAYVPLAIIFFANGQTFQGFFMLVYGFGLIGTIDNLFRFTLARRIGNVHPLITVFGVIVGLKLFGFIGLIFGPLLISIFILLLRIYGTEFISKQRHLPHQDPADPAVVNR